MKHRQHFYPWMPEPRVSRGRLFVYFLLIIIAWGVMGELDYRDARASECHARNRNSAGRTATYDVWNDVCLLEIQNGKTKKN